MLRKSFKRPAGKVGPTDRTEGTVAHGGRIKESSRPLGSKRAKKGVWSALEENVFGGESEVMQEVDRILHVNFTLTLYHKNPDF